MKTRSLAWIALVATLSAAEVSYTYDPAGRLTAADYGGGKRIEYRYSPGGALVSRVIADTTDSDNDQMADAWEMVHFETTARTGGGDFDGDGTTDADEFTAGTDPVSGTSRFRVIQVLKVEGSPTSLTWTSIPGKRYLIQYRNDLVNPPWVDIGSARQAIDNTMTGEDPGPFVGGRRFYRIVVLDD
jgi:YD repeat-containing protein